jgi:hypothetical protein
MDVVFVISAGVDGLALAAAPMVGAAAMLGAADGLGGGV